MLSQVTHWTEWVAVALEVLLLLRVYSLRLQRTYQYITLACTLTVLIDLSDIIFGHSGLVQTEDRMAVSDRIFVYTRFVWVVAFPLAAFDVFEEMKARMGRIRQAAAIRLISGIVMTLLLAVVMLLFLQGDENAPINQWLIAFAMTMWAGSATASLAFLITIRRVMRTQSLALPRNTEVWLRFFQIGLLLEIASCFAILLRSAVSRPGGSGDPTAVAFDAFNMIYLGIAIALSVWCIWRLRRVPAEDAGIAPPQAA